VVIVGVEPALCYFYFFGLSFSLAYPTITITGWYVNVSI